MSKKLLDKTLRAYVLFSLVVLTISAPLFYVFTERLFVEDADETLFLYQKEFVTNQLPSMKKGDIVQWNKMSRDIKIEENTALKKDSVFYRFYLDTLASENEPYRVLLSPVVIDQEPYTLMARVSQIESEDLIENIALLFCVVLILLLTGLFFITRKLSTRLWLPFYSTLNQIEQFELDKNKNPDLVKTDVEEFTRLNQSVNQLLTKNLSVYQDQKEFIENAAHELQTPLAVFQAKLDLLVQQIPFTPEVSDTLSQLNASASRLSRINKNLLLLSKIENSQYSATEQVLISDVLGKQVAFLHEQAKEKKVSVSIERLSPLILKGNLTLVEIAISNLLLNALRYNKMDGQINIILQHDKLIVSNTSLATSLPVEKLFQRFSQPGTQGGNGLGLSIVKKICDLHGWTPRYDYQNEWHYFEIVF